MHHPDLERQLADLKLQKQTAVQNLRSLATEAIDGAGKVSKTMLMMLPPAGQHPDCECPGNVCLCNGGREKITKKLKKKK